MVRKLALLGCMVVVAGCVASNDERPVHSAASTPDIVYPVPAGYCELSRNDDADAQIVSYFERVNAGRNRVIMVFAHCDDIALFRKDGVPPARTGTYTAPRSAEGKMVDVPRERFVAEIAKTFQRADVKAEIDKQLKRQMDNAEVGNALQRNVNLGLLAKDDVAAYTGNLLTWQADDGTTVRQVAVAGATVVNRRVVSMNLSAPYRDQKSVDALLADQRRNLHRLVASN